MKKNTWLFKLLMIAILTFGFIMYLTKPEKPTVIKNKDNNVVAYDNKHDKLWLLNNSGRGVSWEKVKYHKLSCNGVIIERSNGKHCEGVWILEIKEGF